MLKDGRTAYSAMLHRGIWRADAIQRADLEASYPHWGNPAYNPTSTIHGGRMVHFLERAGWPWDARPDPIFPELTDVWTDGPTWRLGHRLTGRLGRSRWRPSCATSACAPGWWKP